MTYKDDGNAFFWHLVPPLKIKFADPSENKSLIWKDKTKFRGAANTREESNITNKSNEMWSKSGNSLFSLELFIANCMSLGVTLTVFWIL